MNSLLYKVSLNGLFQENNEQTTVALNFPALSLSMDSHNQEVIFIIFPIILIIFNRALSAQHREFISIISKKISPLYWSVPHRPEIQSPNASILKTSLFARLIQMGWSKSGILDLPRRSWIWTYSQIVVHMSYMSAPQNNWSVSTPKESPGSSKLTSLMWWMFTKENSTCKMMMFLV